MKIPYKPPHSIYVAIFSLVVSLLCAVVGVQENDGLLKGLAIGMLIMAGINLLMAWRMHQEAQHRA